MSRTIVLLYPRAEPDWPHPEKLQGLPLACLTIARPLVDAGYDVRIVDENASPRALELLRAMPRPLWVGLSVIGGYTITSARRLAREVAALWPGVPRVWGGWNPTLLPELYEAPEVAQEVDVIVRGRGEWSVVELSARIADGRALDGIHGVSYRDEAGVVQRSEPLALEDAPPPGPLPYELVEDLEAYVTRHGALNFVTSWGCPHRCSFCGIPAATRTFRPAAVEAVVEELVKLAQRGIHTFLFLDDNFFTQKQRVLALAREMQRRGLDAGWHSNGRIDQVGVLDQAELCELAEAGLRSINVGYESGDQSVADGVMKDVSVGDMQSLAARMARAGIRLSLNVIVGLPGESADSLVRSIESLPAIHAAQPDLELCWYMYMPAPGTALWEEHIERGLLRRPQSLSEHELLQPLGLEHPWYYESPPRRVFQESRSAHKAIAWTYWIAHAAALPRSRALWPAFRLLRRWCRWRTAQHRFGLALEWRVAYAWAWARRRLAWTRAALGRRRAVERLLGLRRRRRTVQRALPFGLNGGM